MTDEWLTFEKADAVGANTPFVFRCLNGNKVLFSAAQTTAVGTDQPQNSDFMSIAGCNGAGFYTAQVIADDNAYYIAQDKFWKSSGTLQIPAFRSFFRTSSSAKMQGIHFDDPVPTAISQPTENNAAAPVLYDLQGRRVANDKPLHRGIYVADGQKILVR